MLLPQALQDLKAYPAVLQTRRIPAHSGAVEQSWKYSKWNGKS